MLSHHTVDNLGQRQLRQACAELERRLRAGIACRSEELLAEFPAVAGTAEAALELIYTEFVLRRQLGQKPSAAACGPIFATGGTNSLQEWPQPNSWSGTSPS